MVPHVLSKELLCFRQLQIDSGFHIYLKRYIGIMLNPGMPQVS